MTLLELGAEYRASAENVRGQLRELREIRKNETDPDKLFTIEYKITVLKPILTELNKTAERCENYYGCSDGASKHGNRKRVGSDNRRRRKCGTGERIQERNARKNANNNAKRVDADTARNSAICSAGGFDISRSGRRARDLQKLGL